MRTRPSCKITHVKSTNRYYCQRTNQQRQNSLSSSLLLSSKTSSSSSSSSTTTTTTTTTNTKKCLGYHMFIFIIMVFLLDKTFGQQQQQQQQQQQVKYSTRQIRTRYGTLRGIVSRTNSIDGVEVYLGVPYATPPLGSLRYMPPVTPTQWRGTKFADTMPPVCPQKIPTNDPLLSRHRRAYLDKISSILKNQSEDCLYLNLYVPRPIHASETELLPALLLIHGDSYSWGAGNPLDGIALAAHGRIIVVSINFRLGVLGFLKTGSKGSAQGNYGLMDLVAGLHWLRENIEAFGGNPENLSVLGHGTGAALANFLAVSPMSNELVEKVILLGGSALSSWAIQRDPLSIKRKVADTCGCHGDIENDDITTCLRSKNIDELLDVKLELPRFTSGFAPFVDGAVLPSPIYQTTQPTASSAGIWPLLSSPGSEFAALNNRDILIGLTSSEALLDLNEDDFKNGLNETRRDKILRTYVRNTYRYHLHEIYSTLRNEYTDWEKTEQSPVSMREGLLSLLGDGQVAAPLLKLALLHSTSGGRGYFLHFQPGERPSQRGEELPYLLGFPLLRNDANHYNLYSNYTQDDEILSRMLIRYLSNFIRRGDPNEGNIDGTIKSALFWDSYDSINQLYLEASKSPAMRSHYRGHKMSLWLNLLPQLHRPGYEISMRHHHLSESPNLYEGAVRPQIMAMPLPAPPLEIPSPTEASMSSTKQINPTECTPNVSAFTKSSSKIKTTTPSTTSTHPKLSPGPNNLLHKFSSNHYQSYTTALTVTIAVGIFLLLLNILIFAGIYQQRDRNINDTTIGTLSITTVGQSSPSLSSSSSSNLTLGYIEKKKKEQLLEAGCSNIEQKINIKNDKLKKITSSTFLLNDTTSSITTSPSVNKKKLAQELEMQLQDFKCSTLSINNKRMTIDPPSYLNKSFNNKQRSRTPSPCVDIASRNNEINDNENDDISDDEFLPEPPPPPKAPLPSTSTTTTATTTTTTATTATNTCPGILRQPGTPGSAKKRVQIQEISV